MTITIRLQTDNAAFGESHEERHAETLRILRDWLADADSDESLERERLRDVNGNIVGSVKVSGR